MAVPVVFALIFLLGTVGNGLVLAVLLQPSPSAWQEPGSTTDLFILNLAVADLCFILCCVPFQAAIYTLDAWLFGALVCKAVHLLIYLTMYASSFTLAAVSVDRCAVPGTWRGLGWGGTTWPDSLGRKALGTKKGDGRERKNSSSAPTNQSLGACLACSRGPSCPPPNSIVSLQRTALCLKCRHRGWHVLGAHKCTRMAKRTRERIHQLFYYRPPHLGIPALVVLNVGSNPGSLSS